MSRHVIPDVPYLQDIMAPRCHVTSFRMILEFYDIKYTASYLMTLSGLNFGFTYFKGWNMAYSCPATPDGPWEILAYAADKMGCKAIFVKNKPWNETWKLLKDWVNKDVPVLIARLDMQYLWKTAVPICHVVVLCGYDEEKGVVMVNDPALGEVGEGARYLPPNKITDKSGNYAEFSIEDFKKACDLKAIPWAFEGINGFCVLSPPTRRRKISWAEVLERNARLTLGQIDEALGKRVGTNNVWGPKGIREFAADLERGFGLSEKEAILKTLVGLRMLAFQAGNAYKADASAVVAGMAAVTGNRELEKAAYSLKSAGQCFEQGLAEIDYVVNRPVPPEVLKAKLVRISELLKRAAIYEEQTGESLSKAAKAFD